MKSESKTHSNSTKTQQKQPKLIRQATNIKLARLSSLVLFQAFSRLLSLYLSLCWRLNFLYQFLSTRIWAKLSDEFRTCSLDLRLHNSLSASFRFERANFSFSAHLFLSCFSFIFFSLFLSRSLTPPNKSSAQSIA